VHGKRLAVRIAQLHQGIAGRTREVRSAGCSALQAAAPRLKKLHHIGLSWSSEGGRARVQSTLTNVRLGSKADMCAAPAQVRFSLKSRHVRCNL